jgi:hypothetical protein
MNKDYLAQYTAEEEFKLLLGQPEQKYSSGACARDTPTPRHGQVERIVLGTIKINLKTGEIV